MPRRTISVLVLPPYVFFCRWLPHYFFSFYSSDGPRATLATCLAQISRRRGDEQECNQCREKCACTTRARKEAHEDKTSEVDVISSIAPRLEECSGSSWATCFNAFQTTEGHSRWGRCRSPAQPSSRLSFRFTIGLDPVEWHISTKTGLSSLGIITGLVGQDKVWGRRRGEEKKLSHSVSRRPPVNGQSPQSLE